MNYVKKLSILTLCILLSVCSVSFAEDTSPCPKKILLIGPPASGKGTQGDYISQYYSIPTISTGHLLRQMANEQTPEGDAIRKTMSEGKLVPDNVVLALLKKRLTQNDAQKGFILDGFPRTLDQAKALAAEGIEINTVIVLQVDDNTAIQRISGRRVHAGSGRTYHLQNNPPKVAGLDDVTGEPLTQREDDTKEAIKKRLQHYHEKTEPVINWYQQQAAKNHALQVVKVDSTQPTEKIQSQINGALNNIDSCHIHH